MIDDEEEVAFRLWTADTGNASRIEWNVYGNRDKYQRMARAAIYYLRYDEGTRMGHHPTLFPT